MHVSSFRWTGLWPALLMALAGLVAAGAILGLIHFRDQAAGQNQAELSFAKIQANANRIDSLEWHAIAEEGISRSGLREARFVARRILRGFADVPDSDAAVLGRSFGAYSAALKAELRLLAAGKMPMAERVDESRVDPAFKQFNDALKVSIDRSATAARKSIAVANTAAVAIGVFAAIALFGLFAVFYRNRQRSLALQLRQDSLLHRIELADSLARSREHDANHDMLTGLSNRRFFLERLEEEVDSAKVRGVRLAVLLLDLDRFKEVNDTLGHQAGDLLLQQVKPRLESVLREGDILARLGGDEFALLVPAGTRVETEAVCELADRVADALADPFEVHGLDLRISASIGIALFPAHGEDSETLLRHADVAMYKAKAERCGHALYASESDGHSLQQLSMAGELREALDARHFVLHYQPKVELDSSTIVGTEALIRWDHPSRGLLQPSEFLPGVELTGLMGTLTRYVLDRAIAQVAAWERERITLNVAVNLSSVDVVDRALPQEVAELLERHGVEPARLQLEITENLIMADPARVTEVIAEFARLGIRLSLDDFGTGHSSLAHLRRLNVHEVKIDRSFITNLSCDAEDAAIVRSTIELAHSLELNVVAEGIENDEAWRKLQRYACDEGQGYLISKPVPAAEISQLFQPVADPELAKA